MPQISPIILTGQVYLDETKNSYLVVTKRHGETVTYSGEAYPGCPGFRGMMEDEQFIKRFRPVDPADLTPDEARNLVEMCPPGTVLTTGYVAELADA